MAGKSTTLEAAIFIKGSETAVATSKAVPEAFAEAEYGLDDCPAGGPG